MKGTFLILAAWTTAIAVAEVSRRGHVELPGWLLFVLVAAPLVGAVLYVACGPLEGE